MWSIGIYKGKTINSLKPIENNPVITKDCIKEFDAEFVADPFMWYFNDRWYLFFEALNSINNRGEIGVSCSKDLVSWEYLGIALKEKFHISYPFIFEHKGKIYMSPETLGAKGVVLYEAVEFPLKWKAVKILVHGQHADPTILYYKNLWWLFTCETPYQYDSLSIYWATELDGDWKKHPLSPVYTKQKSHSRPGGRIFDYQGELFRFFQNCENIYGEYLGVAKIIKLSPTEFEENIITEHLLGPTGCNWNKERMHHADCHKVSENMIVACVDGFSRK